MIDNLKDKLLSGEENYDAKAWEELSSKLDVLMPVSKPYFTRKLKFAGLGAVLLAGIFVFISLSEKEMPKKDSTISAKKDKSSVEFFAKNDTNFKTTEQSLAKSLVSTNIPENNVGQNETKPNVENQVIDKNLDKIESQNKLEVNSIELKTKEIDLVQKVENQQKIIFPKVNESYCMGEKVTIYNSNSENIVVTNNQSVQVIVKGKTTKILDIEEAGNYNFKYFSRGDETVEQPAFTVQPSKNLNIQHTNELVYENGIPYIEISSKDFNEQSQWKSNRGKIDEINDRYFLRCFDKGTYELSLSQKGQNNCVSQETVAINIKDQYNLLAVNAFIPNDHNPKNRTFMPEALKYRQSAFKLIVLDPKDNHVVFQSESVDYPWDGTDQMTGKIVDANKLFIWKVDLKQPELKEKSEYTGTVVRL